MDGIFVYKYKIEEVGCIVQKAARNLIIKLKNK